MFPCTSRPSCTTNRSTAPYTAPHKEYFSTEQLVKGPLPQFAYQLHLASGEVEKSVNDDKSIGQFLKGVYGARGPNGELVFDPEKGIIAENLDKVGESRILNGEVSIRLPLVATCSTRIFRASREGVARQQMTQSCVVESIQLTIARYSNTMSSSTQDMASIPLVSPLHEYLTDTNQAVNWYRQRRTNWEEDQALLDKKIIQQPVLFIQATYDSVLKPEMSKSMDALIPKLTRGEVAATHWALTQKPEQVNTVIRQWLEKEGLVKAKSAL